MIFEQCASGNYRPGRSGGIEYIVIHYTAGNGETARNNLQYFARNTVGASAHYFVDESEACQSVRDSDTAWHCGASRYVHPDCRNSNSIGIELCSRIDSAGNYYFQSGTVERAAALTREKMAEYGINADHVVRHYDVTGKCCPAPMVKHPSIWENFKARLTAHGEEQADMEDSFGASSYAEEAARWAVERGYIQGDGQGQYRWQSALTREQFAVVLKRFAQANGLA